MRDGIGALNRAIEILGGLSAATRKLRVRHYQTIQQWRRSGVPTMHCPAIERATGGAITCEELRPDHAAQWIYLRRSAKAIAEMPDEVASAN